MKDENEDKFSIAAYLTGRYLDEKVNEENKEEATEESSNGKQTNEDEDDKENCLH